MLVSSLFLSSLVFLAIVFLIILMENKVKITFYRDAASISLFAYCFLFDVKAIFFSVVVSKVGLTSCRLVFALMVRVANSTFFNFFVNAVSGLFDSWLVFICRGAFIVLEVFTYVAFLDVFYGGLSLLAVVLSNTDVF